MAKHHRVFIAFAKPDITYRDLFVGQGKNERVPFEFTDMSVKEPWNNEWKTRCRVRIRGCDGLIALVSGNTATADGQQWEIKCAREEGLPQIGIYISDARPYISPEILSSSRIFPWKWDVIKAFLNTL